MPEAISRLQRPLSVTAAARRGDTGAIPAMSNQRMCVLETALMMPVSGPSRLNTAWVNLHDHG
jgi:hypothetical protein